MTTEQEYQDSKLFLIFYSTSRWEVDYRASIARWAEEEEEAEEANARAGF
jgi:hypothetical protein